MTTTSLREGELVLALPDGVEGRQFDSADHRLSHCMKAVDWIIKRQDQLLFVEVKDPASGAAQRHTDVGKTLKAYQSGSLIPDLVAKFRDTFLYGWACEWTLARVSYFVILTGVDSALLLVQTDELSRRVPVGSQASWHRSLARRCAMFDIDSWNREFPDMQLTRQP